MDVFLQQVKPLEVGSQAWLRSGQFVTLGTSRRADFRLHGDGSLPPICAHLEVRERDCVVTHAAAGASLLVVNGRAKPSAVLESGDIIRIGKAELRVRWELKAEDRDAESHLGKRDYTERTVATGVLEWSPDDGSDWPMRALIDQLSSPLCPLLIVNGKLAGDKVPAWVLREPDWYQAAPEEVRNEHSLHVLAERPIDELWEVYEPLHADGVATWAFSRGATQTVMSQAQIYLAWFARPGVLEQSLRRGSEMLVEGLFRPFWGFCFRPAGGGDWVYFGKPDSDPGEHGFSAPPIRRSH